MTTNVQVPDRMVSVPEGEFVMGTDKAWEKQMPAYFGLKNPPYENEQPMHKVFLNAFYIHRFEVTFIEYKHFLEATQAKLPDYWKNMDLKQWGRFPVVNVSWFEADSYCRWNG